MKTLKQQIETRCIHFTGIRNNKCNAGMVYDDVDQDQKMPYRAALPCHKPDKYLPEGETQCHCPHVKFSTVDEVQQELDAHKEQKDKFMRALEVVGPIREEQRGRNWEGTVQCPNCKGVLHLSHAACNGHVWGKCETDGCVAWME